MFNLKEFYVYTVKKGKLKMYYNKGNRPISSKKRQNMINEFYADENELNMERKKFLKRNPELVQLHNELKREDRIAIYQLLGVIVALIIVIKLLLKLIF